MNFLVVTGLSGAGKTRAAGCLEDIGFYCVDNIPVPLIRSFSDFCIESREYEKVAIVTDIRGGHSFDGLYTVLDGLKCEYGILFIEASRETIITRYKETRRPHPLASGLKPLAQAVAEEEELMKDLRLRADYIINTTSMTHAQLRRRMLSLFSSEKPGKSMSVNITAFGFKYGLPPDADMVLDVRFLPNPYYVDHLRALTGFDEEVKKFILSFSQTGEYIKITKDMLTFLLPEYAKEGKSELVIALGCTGGRHRSVMMAEELAGLISRLGYEVTENYRELQSRS